MLYAYKRLFLKPQKSYDIRGYTAVNKSRQDAAIASGGLATYVRQGLNYSEREISTPFEAQSVTVVTVQVLSE
jgi:hypothetical protein